MIGQGELRTPHASRLTHDAYILIHFYYLCVCI